MRERAAPARPPIRWEVVVRAYDDGIAFRYRFALVGQPGDRRRAGRPSGCPMARLGLCRPMVLHHARRGRSKKRPVAEFPREWLVGLPLLVELPGTGWAAIMEAGLVDYSAMYVVHDDAKARSLASRLSPLPSHPKVAVPRRGLPPEHELPVPFTRMLAGPLTSTRVRCAGTRRAVPAP